MSDMDLSDMERNGDDMKSGNSRGGDPRENIRCERVLELAPTYADGELSSSLADSVRVHLMDCSPCRLAIQDQSNLSAWFVPSEEVPVPEDFAARVAGYAAAGLTTGSSAAGRQWTLTPQAASAASGSSVGASPQGAFGQHEPVLTGPVGVGTGASNDEGGKLLSFAVALTSVAAAAALFLTMFLTSQSEPDMGEGPIQADSNMAFNLEALDQENRALENGALTEGTQEDPSTGSSHVK